MLNLMMYHANRQYGVYIYIYSHVIIYDLYDMMYTYIIVHIISHRIHVWYTVYGNMDPINIPPLC